MNKNNTLALDKMFSIMSVDDIAKVKSFCENSKMIYNEKVDKYDFNAHKSNVRLCNFGKSDVCRTASIWYSPKRCDYGIRIERDTLENLKKSTVNQFLLDTVKAIESQETNKQNEFRFSFSSLDFALKFFTDLQSNYRKFVADSKKSKEVIGSELKKA